ncbi:uncharacterized protein C18orf19 homolog A [Phlebotomus argentipes]|uniref:uncharacterized protein C18orf19 homolog A n=1 Tax=Phlebotomus argentipes TaxID=94469 RepID=UPI0028933751|nr:uncharacterized protein C18orf19 homolog A [Phlebotomus argentipes]
MTCRQLVRVFSRYPGQNLYSRLPTHARAVRKVCPLAAGSFLIKHPSDLWSDCATRAFSQTLQQRIRSSEYSQCAEKPQKSSTEELAPEPPKKEGLVARFKKMYKEYWYVLLPVHIVTSTGWLGGFYYLSKSGVDIATILETLHFNETIISHLRDSHLGHLAIAYFLYKIFTPLRYMVTLGGTTLSIKYLSHWGYIKPVPSKDRLMQIYQDKKAARIQAREDRRK